MENYRDRACSNDNGAKQQEFKGSGKGDAKDGDVDIDCI